MPNDPPIETTARPRFCGLPLYWLCQLGGWGAVWAMGVVEIPDGSALPAYPWPAFLRDAIYYGSAIGLTHLLRGHIHRRGWLALTFRAWLPKALAATALLAVAHLFFNLAAWAVFRAQLPAITVALVLAASWLGSFVEFTAWTGFYIGYHLQRRFAEMQLHRAEEMSAARHAALQALRAQVNPHFLFNSLNTLRALIDENPAQAREVVTQLAQLFRAALETDAAPLIPLREEWRTVEAYLAIERARHEARLRIAVALEPAALEGKVPPFLVQTVVENAVKFGVAPYEEGGEIRIAAKLENGALAIEVTNRGPLAPAAPGTTGTGLANARARLRLLFDGRAALTLAERNGLVTTRIVIPQSPP